MLDVFTIGFALFVREADAIVAVDAMSGLNYLWVAVAMNYTLDFVTSVSIYRYVNDIKQQELEKVKFIL